MRPTLRSASCALLAAGLLAAASCSSAPPKSDTVTNVKRQAADAAASGEAYFRQGRYDLALQFFSQALSAYTSVDDVEGAARTSISVGQVYLATDRVDEAADMFTRARERARGLGSSLFVDSSISLGELYLRRDQPGKALSIFQEALAVPGAGSGGAGGRARSPLTPEQTGVLYHNIGAAWKASGDLDKAMESFNRSLAINLEHKLSAEAAADYYMIASVYSKQENYVQAAHSAQDALAMDKKIENSPAIAQDLRALGLIARKSGDAVAAYDYFQRSYLVFSTLAMKDQMKKSLADLAQTAEALGLTSEAQRYRALLAQAEAQ